MSKEFNRKNPPPRILETIVQKCTSCGEEFVITPAEQKYYFSKDFELPKRCKNCRKKKKEKTIITCVDCGVEFEIDEIQKEYYKNNNLHIPKRCPECRIIKAKRNEELNGN